MSKEFDEPLPGSGKCRCRSAWSMARPRTFFAIAIGIVAFFLLPGSLRLVTRLLVGWDIFAALYLVLAYVMMFRCDRPHPPQRDAAGRRPFPDPAGDGARRLRQHRRHRVRARRLNRSAAGLILAMVTIALSWAAVHTTFSLHYAHDYYRGNKPGGLQFPSGDEHDDADYWDFVYFSFVIGMTAQVSDVGITDKIIRRTATVHGIISFVFNTALVALMVNIAASAI